MIPNETKQRIKDIKKHKFCEQPEISVIVPVYKVDRYLTKCLCSIVNQTMEELEIIIVDEGEQDRCREIIDFFAEKDPRVIAIHQKNGGYGASCNLGIDISKGEFLSIIESDDFIEPEMFEDMYAYAKELDADVIKTPYFEYLSNGTRIDCPHRKLMEESLPQNICFSSKEFGELLQIHASLWSCIYRKSYMKQKNIRFIEAKGASYVDVGFRIDTLINTEKLAWLDKPYYNYRVDSLGSSTNNFKLSVMLQRWKEVHEMFKFRQEEYDKYYGPRLILDEYYNSVGWLWLISATDEECRQITYNLNFVDPKMIQSTPYLTDDQKNQLLDFKNSPLKFINKANRHRKLKKLRIPAEKTLNILSDYVLLNWMFVGFFTSLSISIALKTGLLFLFSTPQLETISNLLIFAFSIGIIFCFIGKALRKLYFIIWKGYCQAKKKNI